MFWRFGGGYANISTLDTILDKSDLTLEELLDESDLIQELKQQNSKLIEFLREQKRLTKLLEYVVTDKVPEEADQKDTKQDETASGPVSFFARSGARSSSKASAKAEGEETDQEKKEAQRKKYAYVACEVLSSEVWSITEAVLDNREALKHFWQYVYRPAPLDPLQAGYFTKVNENLLDKKTEDMLAFFRSLDGVVDAMLQHVDCPMIMDLLLKIISLEKAEGGAGIVGWLQTQRLIPSLLAFLSPQHSPATQTSAGDFLKAIITISANATTQDQSVIGPNELTRELVSDHSIHLLIQEMLRGGNPLTVGVGIVIEVIRKNNSDYDIDTNTDPVPRSSDPIYLGTLLRQFAEHIGDFMHLIRSSKSKRAGLKAAFGASIEPLGFDRFKTCELMAELLHCSNMGLLNERGAEEEIRKRDAERERLRAEGKLLPARASDNTADNEGFSSSVDSHGFHHAEKPSDDEGHDLKGSDSNTATDEDEFEKVLAPTSDELPDEVSFDDLQEKQASKPDPLHFDPPPTRAADSPVTASVTHDFDSMNVDERESPADADKPAPLFASKKSTPARAPSSNASSSDDDVVASTATIQPESMAAPIAEQEHPMDVDDGSPVVGDLLKIKFVENHVVPTILDFFFRFPWNNFLHNVVYDVVQQVFNGALERGYNRELALNLFENIPPAESSDESLGLISLKDITDRILDGQAASDKSQKDRNMRLGYMGHLTLIAEEVCKFGVRYAGETPDSVVSERTSREAWTQYIDGTLTETRDKDNAVLGGVRPESAMARGLGGNMQSFGSGSNALAQAGIGSGISEDDGLMTTDSVEEGFDTGGSNILSRFGDEDGDDDDLDDADDGGEHARSSPFTDEEQGSSQDTLTPVSSSKGVVSIPPPLNIAPSRARRQLAARLAQKKKDAEAAEHDPDSADDVALSIANELPEEPSEIDLGPATERELQEAGLQITGMHGMQAGDGTASRFSGLFGSDDSSSDSSLDEDQAGRDETLDREEADFEDEPLTFGRRGPRHDPGLPRRPSTTEAKTRRPLDDDED